MKRTISTELADLIDQTVKIRGWLHNLRELGRVNFLIIRDMRGLVQVVVQDKAQLKELRELQVGSVLEIVGKVAATSHTDMGVEIVDPRITVEVPIKEAPPIPHFLPELNNEHLLVSEVLPVF